MARKISTNLGVPAALLILVVAGSSAFVLWSESRQNYFASRYFRVLGRIADHIGDAAGARRDVIFHAVRGEQLEDLRALRGQATILVSSLAAVECAFDADSPRADCSRQNGTSLAVSSELPSQPPRLDLTLESRTAAEWMTVTYDGPINLGERWVTPSQPITVESDVGPLIARVIEPSLTSPFADGSRFDFLVVTDPSGARIVHAPEGSAGRVRSLEELRDTDGQRVPIEVRDDAVDVVFEGRRYKLFVSPLPIQLAPLSSGGTGVAVEWRIAGLVLADRFRADALEIHYGLLISTVFLGLLLIVAYPLFELALLGSRESLSRYRLARLFATAVGATSLTTLMVVDTLGYQSINRITNDQLTTLGQEIYDSFHHEVDRLDALAQRLTHYDGDHGSNPANGAQVNSARPPRVPSILSDPELSRLVAGHEPPLDPHFAGQLETLAWIDAQGDQRAKWSVRRSVPPIVNVSRRAYFRGALAAGLVPADERPPAIEIIQSMTTGETRLALARPMSQPPVSSLDPAVVAITAHPDSVVAPVLPDGYRFVIINRDGLVLLDSEAGYRHGDRFIEEAEHDGDLLTAFQGRAPRSFNISYEGNFHRARLVPLTADLHLVLLRDTRQLHSSNIQVLWITTVLLAAGFVLLFGLLFVIQQLFSARLVWMLESETMGHRYTRLAAGFGLTLVGFVVAVVFWPPGQLLALGALMVPLFALVAYRCLEVEVQESEARFALMLHNYTGVKLSSNRAGGLDVAILLLVVALVGLAVGGQGDGDYWLASVVVVVTHTVGLLAAARMIVPPLAGAVARPKYVAVAATLFLALLAIAPTLALYRVVGHFEVNRFARGAQIRLAEALDARANRIQTETRNFDVPASETGRPTFLETRLSIPAPDVFTAPFLLTEVRLLPPGEDAPTHTAASSPEAWSLLSTLATRTFELVALSFDEHSRRLAAYAEVEQTASDGLRFTQGHWPEATLVGKTTPHTAPGHTLRISSTAPRLPTRVLLAALGISALAVLALLWLFPVGSQRRPSPRPRSCAMSTPPAFCRQHRESKAIPTQRISDPAAECRRRAIRSSSAMMATGVMKYVTPMGSDTSIWDTSTYAGPSPAGSFRVSANRGRPVHVLCGSPRAVRARHRGERAEARPARIPL